MGALGSTPGSSAQKRRRPRGQPPQPAGTDAPQGAQPQQPQTFAQMQSEGRARPAPPAPQPATGQMPGYQGSGQANQVRGQLQQSVSQALQTPSRYDTNTFNTIRDAAYGDLKDQFAKIRDTTDTNLARRGLAASTFGANDLHDVDAAQSRAMADVNSTLLREAANTQAADRSAAYGMGSDLAGMAGAQDLATYGANANTANQNFQNRLSETLGLGNLDLNRQQLAQSGAQFDKSYGLQERQAGEQARQFDLQQELARTLGVGGLDLQKQQLAQSGSQFDRTFGEQGRQFDLQQELSKTLGLGNLDLQKQQLAQSGNQFQQTYDLNKQAQDTAARQFEQTYGLNKTAQDQQAQQFKDQLAQQLGIAKMGDDTQNRSLQLGENQGNNAFLVSLLQALGKDADLSKYLPASMLPGGSSAPAASIPAPSAIAKPVSVPRVDARSLLSKWLS